MNTLPSEAYKLVIGETGGGESLFSTSIKAYFDQQLQTQMQAEIEPLFTSVTAGGVSKPAFMFTSPVTGVPAATVIPGTFNSEARSLVAGFSGGEINVLSVDGKKLSEWLAELEKDIMSDPCRVAQKLGVLARLLAQLKTDVRDLKTRLTGLAGTALRDAERARREAEEERLRREAASKAELGRQATVRKAKKIESARTTFIDNFVAAYVTEARKIIGCDVNGNKLLAYIGITEVDQALEFVNAHKAELGLDFVGGKNTYNLSRLTKELKDLLDRYEQTALKTPDENIETKDVQDIEKLIANLIAAFPARKLNELFAKMIAEKYAGEYADKLKALVGYDITQYDGVKMDINATQQGSIAYQTIKMEQFGSTGVIPIVAVKNSALKNFLARRKALLDIYVKKFMDNAGTNICSAEAKKAYDNLFLLKDKDLLGDSNNLRNKLTGEAANYLGLVSFLYVDMDRLTDKEADFVAFAGIVGFDWNTSQVLRETLKNAAREAAEDKGKGWFSWLGLGGSKIKVPPFKVTDKSGKPVEIAHDARTKDVQNEELIRCIWGRVEDSIGKIKIVWRDLTVPRK